MSWEFPFDILLRKAKSVKTFEESKGNVINDFQNEIEKNWLATLRERFKVDINKKVLAKVKSQINQ